MSTLDPPSERTITARSLLRDSLRALGARDSIDAEAIAEELR